MPINWPLFLFGVVIHAQEKMIADTTAVYSIDGILKEALRITAGEGGRMRNFAAFRALFLPTAHFTVVYNSDSFPTQAETASLEEFITYLHDPYYDDEYVEYELGKSVDEYNGIAQVFQVVYHKDGDRLEGKGVNSYQLVWFDGRWWIANVVWTNDLNGVPVPEKFLRN